LASKRKHTTNRRYQKDRRITVRGVRRDPPDIRKLSRALISLAMAEAEREAQAEQTAREAASASRKPRRPQEGGPSND
jgi:hypothetical protein